LTRLGGAFAIAFPAPRLRARLRRIPRHPGPARAARAQGDRWRRSSRAHWAPPSLRRQASRLLGGRVSASLSASASWVEAHAAAQLRARRSTSADERARRRADPCAVGRAELFRRRGSTVSLSGSPSARRWSEVIAHQTRLPGPTSMAALRRDDARSCSPSAPSSGLSTPMSTRRTWRACASCSPVLVKVIAYPDRAFAGLRGKVVVSRLDPVTTRTRASAARS